MKKPPLVDNDEWENNEQEQKESGEKLFIIFCLCVLSILVSMCSDTENSEMDSDLKMPLSPEEAEIRSYLSNEGNLSEEVMMQFLRPFWYEEPYR